MPDDKVEGKEKTCGNCKLDLICVKITKEWKGKTETKLQWQTKATKKAHFKFAGEGKYNCILPGNTEAPAETKHHDPTKTNIVVGEAPKPEEKLTDDIAALPNEQLAKFVMAELILLKEIEGLVKKTLPDDAPDAKIGMYVKEIYRKHQEYIRS